MSLQNRYLRDWGTREASSEERDRVIDHLNARWRTLTPKKPAEPAKPVKQKHETLASLDTLFANGTERNDAHRHLPARGTKDNTATTKKRIAKYAQLREGGMSHREAMESVLGKTYDAPPKTTSRRKPTTLKVGDRVELPSPKGRRGRVVAVRGTSVDVVYRAGKNNVLWTGDPKKLKAAPDEVVTEPLPRLTPTDKGKMKAGWTVEAPEKGIRGVIKTRSGSVYNVEDQNGVQHRLYMQEIVNGKPPTGTVAEAPTARTVKKKPRPAVYATQGFGLAMASRDITIANTRSMILRREQMWQEWLDGANKTEIRSLMSSLQRVMKDRKRTLPGERAQARLRLEELQSRLNTMS